MKDVSAESLTKILEFEPLFNRPFDDWKFDQWGFSLEFHQFVNALTTTDFVYPFDWNTWLIETGHSYGMSHTILLDADLSLLRKIMTAVVRANRYNDGLHADLVRSGFFRVFCERLRQLQPAA